MASRAAGRFRHALMDPAQREGAVLLALAFYVVLWTIYGTIAKGSQGLHPDMTELVAWSRDLSLGYLKHPPLAAWIVRGWFELMPLTETSYYLLAMLMPAIALWFYWRVSEDFLDIEKRVVGLALLTLIPVFQFSCVEVQRQHRADAAMGGDHVLVFAFLSHAQHALCGAGRHRRRRLHAWQILVGVSAGGIVRGRVDRYAARAIFPFLGAVDHRRRGRRRSGAACLLAGAQSFCALHLCAWWCMARSR